MITDQLAGLVGAALEGAIAAGDITATSSPEVSFERPRRREHGDWATNVALSLAQGGGNPRAIAEAIVKHMPDSELIEQVEVAGPGFLNFKLADSWLHDVVRQAADPSQPFGRGRSTGTKINVEFVSANPTGPINVVSGRHAAVGDAIASLLDAAGHEVTREFYVNDAGRQARLFGESIAARYLELHGHQAEVPEGGYQGDYVRDIAKEISDEIGESLVDADPEARNEEFRKRGLAMMLEEMKASLERFGTTHDVWFSEESLHKAGDLDRAREILEEKGLVEERDGALWLRTTTFGDDKDRVLVRATGEPTYLAADAAYLMNKFERGFDRLIYLWGADHHGAIARLKAAAQGLGFDPERVEVPIIQVVSLSSGAESLKGSKRAGVIVRLDDLVEEVGADAARYTFLTRSMDAPLDFDVAAVKEQAPENPVYYVQYAHARICSIIAKGASEGHTPDASTAPLERLVEPAEDQLMRRLSVFEEVISEAAAQRAPQRMTRYVEELASDFSSFYRDCKVVTDDAELTAARLALCVATRRVIADGLALLGVSAPERM
ncbi:MAG: arginyl-tRNA synthetase [Actinomycetota bacterium]|nr:arginyl-tRNA synthetase [Actinomycetota bacterium]